MGRRGKRKRAQAVEMNNRQYNMYYEWLEQLACSIYRWEGLPEEIDERFLELCLFNRGLSVFFFDTDYDKFFSLEGTPSGHINMYQNPLQYLAYGADGYRKTLSASECVPIWANYLRRPDVYVVDIYARRLADIDRTIDVNLAMQKMPAVLTAPESQRLTIMNAIKQWQGNEPVMVWADGMFDPDTIHYLTSGAPFIVQELLKAKQTIWAEIMTYLGINNTNISKAERVQSAEVMANDGQIEASRLTRLNCRRMACEQINRKYGLDVRCYMNKDIASKNFDYLRDVSNFIGGGVDDKDGESGNVQQSE